MAKGPRSSWLVIVAKRAPKSWEKNKKKVLNVLPLAAQCISRKKFSGLSELAPKRIRVLGPNVHLLCNDCVGEKQHQSVKMLAERNASRSQNLETEVTDLKKSVPRIKSILNEKVSSRKFLPRPVQPLAKHEESKWTAPIEELNGIRNRGKPESKAKDARERQEHDLTEMEKVLVHLEVDTSFTYIVSSDNLTTRKSAIFFWTFRTRGNGDSPYLLQPNWKLSAIPCSWAVKFQRYKLNLKTKPSSEDGN